MRAVLLASLFVVAVFAGCLSTDRTPTAVGVFEIPPLDPASIVVPENATLVETAAGAVLQFLEVDLPFTTPITIPAGAVQVSVEATVDEDETVRTTMRNEETGRRRCNTDVVQGAWAVPYTGTHRCSGIALLDPPGTNWTVDVSSAADRAQKINVTFERIEPDGLLAGIDFGALSMPMFDLLPTETTMVTSFDGVPLWVEVTLPDGDGPWPTVVSSSPYNGQTGRLGQPGGTPAMWDYFTHDWAKRGYAVVNADVRGYGLSGGCVEVWGANEQRDQAVLVDWVAAQPWSDGNVGFYGQSYVGTTPVAAAVQAPEALKAIIAVAPVINAYRDWHYGGVPNGENSLSPYYYQLNTDPLPRPDPNDPTAFDPTYYADPVNAVTNKLKGICDPTLVVRANDPRAIYDDFYVERDFSLRAADVEAAVLYTQGFEDANVKSAMIPGWFNDITAPKLGVFGHWVHQHPTRADEEILFLGWMDQWVKGRQVGLDALPSVVVNTNVESERTDDAWPPLHAAPVNLYPDYAGNRFSVNASDATGATLVIGNPADVDHGLGADRITVSYPVPADLAIAGTVRLQLNGTLRPGGNAFIAADLYDVHNGTRDRITHGRINLAHNADHTTWTPITGPVAVVMPFLPTEYVLRAGHELVLEVYGIARESLPGTGLPSPVALPGSLPVGVIGVGPPTGIFEIGAHPGGAGPLVLPTLPMDAYAPMPRTAEP